MCHPKNAEMLKKLISTSQQHVKHPLAGQNTQLVYHGRAFLNDPPEFWKS